MLDNDVNPNDFLDSKQSEADSALLVRFFIKPVQDKSASLEAGRPIFKETVYIDIRIPGERDSAAVRPASNHDIKRFPRHYAAFKVRNDDPQEIGTPLAEWPVISRSQAEELSFFNVKTVEQLAGMPDSGNHQFRGVVSLKNQAKEWLLENKDKEALKEEFSKREQSLKDQLTAMQEQLDSLTKPKAKAKTRATPKKKVAAKKESVNASTADLDS